jgi:hypothetical protein
MWTKPERPLSKAPISTHKVESMETRCRQHLTRVTARSSGPCSTVAPTSTAVVDSTATCCRQHLWGGHNKVVKVLLTKGADVNAQGGEYGNAVPMGHELNHECIQRVRARSTSSILCEANYADDHISSRSPTTVLSPHYSKPMAPKQSCRVQTSSRLTKTHAHINRDHDTSLAQLDKVLIKLNASLFESHDDRGDTELEDANLITFFNLCTGLLELVVDP